MKMRLFSSGFTLIELLVVVAISLVMLGGALAAFLNFTERQKVVTAVEELKAHFASAQAKASSGDLGGCTQLRGYRVQTYLNGSITEVSTRATCTTGTAQAAVVAAFGSGVTVSPNLDMTFLVLNGGVELPSSAASQEITVANGLNEYSFIMYREGRVSEGAWE
jgi:prepilin-type N-terminal cleavage/methylation domain-containing protein